ncbi:PilN family type IVB pilus formation outer membrane protein [Acerihabitans sp. TG2]|uniref:PilN family type IVB pilus formation outer membrane protein n=1 Tax=Acerihabitans sp. TG2 TaxID=3096008 RepID=UPI002B23E7C3|nr:PilN family type IVB pilus formation outer membrane protein [Acerihabitans sp. TG2]MEA9392194.1 PilN family type IVB pilus formation outer membrane protein [Acerihabitans sp. TG2]
MKLKLALSKAVLLSFLIASLSGCAYKNINDTIAKADNTANQTTRIASGMRNQRSDIDSGFTIKNGVWVDTQVVEQKSMQNIPAALNRPCTYAPKMPISFFDAIETISSNCGVAIRLTPDAVGLLSSVSTASVPVSGSPSTQIPAPPEIPGNVTLPPVPNGNTGLTTSYSSRPSSVQNFKFSYQGTLAGVMDRLTSLAGLFYHYDDSTGITVSYIDSKTFSIMAMPSATETATRVTAGTSTSTGASGGASGSSSSSSGGVSGDSGSNSSTSSSIKSDLLADIEKNLRSLLTPNVGRLQLSASTGNVTVTDTPAALQRIGRYVDNENKKITQQVLLNVKILSVTLKDTDELGVNMDLVYKSMSGKWGFNITNAFSSVSTGLTSGSIKIIDPNDRFSGTSALISALSEQGKVSVVTSPSITTLNLQPAPVQVARTTSYLAERSTTTSANVGSQTSLTPGAVTTGFNMTLLPYIMPDTRDLLLQYTINLSSLIQIRKIGTDTDGIEMPEVDSRVFSQRVKLRSGQTLVMAGYEQAADTGNKSGIGGASFWGLGGERNRNSQRDVIVIVITPVILG